MSGLYPMRVVSRLTGLSADTIRVWERRYSAVAPDPDRREQAQIQRRPRASPGSVAPRDRARAFHRSGRSTLGPELRRLIGESSPDIGSQVSLYAAIVEDYLKAVFEYDVRRAESILTRTAAILPPMTLTLEVIVPADASGRRSMDRGPTSNRARAHHFWAASQPARDAHATRTAGQRGSANHRRHTSASPARVRRHHRCVHGCGPWLRADYLGTHMPLEEIAEAAEQSGAAWCS